VRSGIGKVAAATTAALLLDAFDVSALLFTGVARLQDQLGQQNDLVVADALLQQLQRRQARLAPSVAWVRGFLSGQAGDGHARTRRLWKKWQAQDLPR